jgi:hypothetical protein
VIGRYQLRAVGFEMNSSLTIGPLTGPSMRNSEKLPTSARSVEVRWFERAFAVG